MRLSPGSTAVLVFVERGPAHASQVMGVIQSIGVIQSTRGLRLHPLALFGVYITYMVKVWAPAGRCGPVRPPWGHSGALDEAGLMKRKREKSIPS